MKNNLLTFTHLRGLTSNIPKVAEDQAHERQIKTTSSRFGTKPNAAVSSSSGNIF